MSGTYVRFDLLDDLVGPEFENAPKSFTDWVWWIVKRLPAHFLLIDVYRQSHVLGKRHLKAVWSDRA